MRVHQCLTHSLRKPHHKIKNCNSSNLLKSVTFSPRNPSLQSFNISTKRSVLAWFLQRPLPDNFNNKRITCYKQVHAQIAISGLQCDTFLANMLLRNYSKANDLDGARKLFDTMSERNLVSWSSLVSMYTKKGYGEEALMVFIGFLKVGNGRPDDYILSSVICACTQLGGGGDGGNAGEQMHSFVIKSGFDRDVYVGTSLMNLYAKNGSVDDAKFVFDGLMVKTAVSWTTIITGYVKSGRSDLSLNLFNQMRETDVVHDKYLLSSVLSACSMLQFVGGGKQIHAHVLRRGMGMDVSVINVLMDFYSKCGRVKMARRLFDEIEVKNIISWTTLIGGYMQNSFDREAMKLFTEMTRSGWKPDDFACSSVLTSCGSVEALEQGRQVHAYSFKANIESDNFVKNSLVDMYAKCDSLTEARKVFDVMADRNVVSYNAMIEGYSKQEKLSEALDLFHEMRVGFVPPGLLTFVSLLGLSSSVFSLESSKQIHGLIIKYGVFLDVFAGSALIDAYSKCFSNKDARLVFDEMNQRDIVVWNAMLLGYTQQLENEEAIKLYLELLLSQQRPNEFTFAALITAASNLGSLKHGQQFHNHLIKLGLDFDPFITSALIDMYAKCGSLEDAYETFGSTTWKDVACWNSMICTNAHHGEPMKALLLFREMIIEGLEPNYITFVGVLSACSHAGLIEDGLDHFQSMAGFGIEPGMEHYASVASLLGRAGKLYEAKDFIEKMPIKPAAVVWRSLLNACRMFGNVELGRYAAEMAISIDPMDSGSYTLLSNTFACNSMWADAKQVTKKMDLDGVMKEAGRSWIEVNNEVHAFVARDKSHHAADLTYSILDNLILHIKGVGYVPNTSALC